jgi:hypothetical protein
MAEANRCGKASVAHVSVRLTSWNEGTTMANKYGEAALMAARDSSTGPNPAARWERAMEKLYPTSPTSRKKGCPRGAFLGLCEDGLVRGIPAGKYTASKDNKAYAVQAAALLTGESRKWSVGELWRAVSNNREKAHNSQMDVVMALWKNALIVGKT